MKIMVGPLIPIDGVRALYQQVKQGYTQPELIQLSEFANTGHETPTEMFVQAAAWFKHYL